MSPSPGVGTHPDLPDTLVHFTGRPRSEKDVPPDFARGSAEDRMVSVLRGGVLRGTKVFGSDLPVICFSEASEAARRVMLRDGVVERRGPYAPWGLALDREALIDAGVRPVLHLSGEEMRLTQGLPSRLRNRRVRYDPGSSDWLHEREWRLCFDADETPELALTPELVVGVVVGIRGWLPPGEVTPLPLKGLGTATLTRYAAPAHKLARWWWDGEDLVPDGEFDIEEQLRMEATFYEPFTF
ncbi:hypothetical protein [Streptomyces sp. NPDC006971]|uniref:hypothetical protein n=1 Tax=Streptomyces sp. NPDC006971 TaxID=3154784 RepID=UPI003405538B